MPLKQYVYTTNIISSSVDHQFNGLFFKKYFEYLQLRKNKYYNRYYYINGRRICTLINMKL